MSSPLAIYPQDTGKYCFGIKDTMTALEMSSAETLIVWEDLETQRWELKNAAGKITVLHLNPDQEKIRSQFLDPETGAELEVVDKQPLVEWFANNYKGFGAQLEFVTNRSQEGAQFVKGFGGIGALCRWKVDFMGITETIEGASDAIKAAKLTAARNTSAGAAAAAGITEADGEQGGDEDGDGDGARHNNFEEEFDFM